MSKGSILVIEDSEAKLASVTAAVLNVLPSCQIEIAKSVKSAINKLKSGDFRLIIADMSLPTYDVKEKERGGTPRPFGGIEVFDHLRRLGTETPVIVVSSYPAIEDGGTSMTLKDLAEMLMIEYPETFAGYVFFDSTYLTWEEEFKSLVMEKYDESRTA